MTICMLSAVTLPIGHVRAQDIGFGGGLLRVCADPDNMPFSNGKGEGFENKLAELIAAKLQAKVSYVWFPEGSRLVPNTMGNESCDVVMGYAQGTGLIEDTNPYYYTSYVLVFRKGDPSLAGVDDLSDKRLLDKKIGVVAGTPPVSIMAINGLAANAKPFGASVAPGATDPVAEIISKIASGELDAGILWGPLAGYVAQRSKVPLSVVPLVKEKLGPRMLYGITLGIRPNAPEWKHTMNKLIAENQAEIDDILLDYGMPLLDAEGNPVKPATADR
ncbi:MAG TPA: quinoprotein dehydrogenase-associated putative ABC transporter substrate-binding protein [Methyloceanibacter sp.]|nr:quinoprotein dehydrogenase-associated putative ABC transporter substrate-binding protein [Methyloceanibacter sp.]